MPLSRAEIAPVQPFSSGCGPGGRGFESRRSPLGSPRNPGFRFPRADAHSAHGAHAGSISFLVRAQHPVTRQKRANGAGQAGSDLSAKGVDPSTLPLRGGNALQAGSQERRRARTIG